MIAGSGSSLHHTDRVGDVAGTHLADGPGFPVRV